MPVLFFPNYMALWNCGVTYLPQATTQTHNGKQQALLFKQIASKSFMQPIVDALNVSHLIQA